MSDSFFTFFRERASFVRVMRHLTKEEREALFPTTCHFKVIAVSIEGIHLMLNKALESNGIIDCKFQPSAQSKGGKYISYEIALELETHEVMMSIDSDLRQIDGVKMVL
jgi:putative lipoic acid-binding regulatory protein